MEGEGKGRLEGGVKAVDVPTLIPVPTLTHFQHELVNNLVNELLMS